MAIDLWIERYRPKTLEEYVWRDPQMRTKVEEWLDDGKLPHLLLSGVSGTGKTSLMLLLMKLLDIPQEDMLKINASRERKIDDLQDKIVNFVNAWAFNKSGIKYILLDEADKLSQHAQGLLRNEMETYADVCRFVMTCVAPETKVYTNSGWIRADSVSSEWLDTGTGVYIANKALVQSHASQLIKLTTLHSNDIRATPTHALKTYEGWRQAKDFRVGDRIAIALSSQFGNCYDSKADFGDVILDLEGFRKYLLSCRVLPQMAVQEAKDAGIFSNPCYLESVANLPVEVTLRDVASHLSTTLVSARLVVRKLMKTGLIAVRNIANGEKVYRADWQHVHKMVLKRWQHIHNKYCLGHNDYSEFYYDVFERHRKLAVEEILERLNHVFDNECHLRRILGRLTGFLFGDGHLTSKQLHFAGAERDVLDRVKTDLEALVPDVSVIIKPNGRGSRGLSLVCSDVSLVHLFCFLGAPKGAKVGQKMHLPNACYASLAFGRAFVQALFDNDATAPRMAYKNKTFGSITLRQHTKDWDATFHHELSDYMKSKWNIENIVKHSKQFVGELTPSKVPYKDTSPRMAASVQISAQDDILRFFEQIGSYYETYKFRPDMLGYLRYKASIQGYDFLSLDQWKMAFDYVDGCILDKVTLVEEQEYNGDVIDCSLDAIHSYVTEGFVSHNCNYPNKIIPALHGRMQELKFASLDESEFLNRVADVLFREDVQFEPEVLMEYIHRIHPDLRKCLGLLQQNTVNGVLQPLREDDQAAQEYLLKAIELFRQQRYLDGRRMIISQADPEDYDSLYRYLYQHLELFGQTQEQQDDALLVIRKAVVYDGQVADRELNLAACLCELCRISK